MREACLWKHLSCDLKNEKEPTMQRTGTLYAKGTKCKEFRARIVLVCFRHRKETSVSEDEIRSERQAGARSWTL